MAKYNARNLVVTVQNANGNILPEEHYGRKGEIHGGRKFVADYLRSLRATPAGRRKIKRNLKRWGMLTYVGRPDSAYGVGKPWNKFVKAAG